MHFKIHYDAQSDYNETSTIQFFLRWQNCQQYWITDETTIAYTKGKSHIFIQHFKDDILISTYLNFNELYRAFEKKGLLQC